MNNTDYIALAFISLFYLCLGLLALGLFAEILHKICQLASYIIDRIKGEEWTTRSRWWEIWYGDWTSLFTNKD